MSLTVDDIITTKCGCQQLNNFVYLPHDKNVILVATMNEDPNPDYQVLASWIVKSYTNPGMFVYLIAYVINDRQVITFNSIARDNSESAYTFDSEVGEDGDWINMMESIISQYTIIQKYSNVVEFRLHKIRIDINDWTERSNYPKKASQLLDKARIIIIRGPKGIGKTTLAKFLLRFKKCNIISDSCNPGNGESNVIYENRYIVVEQIQQQLRKYPNKIIIITITEDIKITKFQNMLNDLLVINLDREPYDASNIKSMECNFP